MEVALIINVRNEPHIYLHGPLGKYVVPAAEGDRFGLLVVRPEGEIQDMGSGQTRRSEAIPAAKLAVDILGEIGKRWGCLICKADPDVSKGLERAEAAQREYMSENPGEVRSRLNPVRKMHELRTVYEPEISSQLTKLSKRVVEEREKFDEECRKLVSPKE